MSQYPFWKDQYASSVRNEAHDLRLENERLKKKIKELEEELNRLKRL